MYTQIGSLYDDLMKQLKTMDQTWDITDAIRNLEKSHSAFVRDSYRSQDEIEAKRVASNA